jgi:ribulose-bisphosphate carboxylase large chain
VRAGGRRFAVRISYRGDVVGESIAQFFNVLFGNISMLNNVSVVGVDLGDSLKGLFPGPRWGVAGVRRILGVYGRPLACTAVKPVGMHSRVLAATAGAFAAGGIDVIKEDHGLADQRFHPFKERVSRVQDAVRKASAVRGRHTLYAPMINGDPQQVEEQIAHCESEGVRAIVAAPMMIGPAAFAAIVRTHRFVVLAHPALSGVFYHSPVHGISHAVLLGTLFRLIGGDFSIFVNAGGRFRFSRRDCRGICRALRQPLRHLPASFACPAGGMGLDNIGDMAAQYGPDTALLVAGALLRHTGDKSEIAARFVDRIRECFGETLKRPQLGSRP